MCNDDGEPCFQALRRNDGRVLIDGNVRQVAEFLAQWTCDSYAIEGIQLDQAEVTKLIEARLGARK